MKINTIITIIIISLFYSCGSKKMAATKESVKAGVNTYVLTVDKNISLKKEVTEGALTDAEGFKDIGTFKYTVYFDESTKQLVKIENMEKTDTTLHETYYFENGDFVFVSVKGAKTGDSKIYNVGGKDGDSKDLKFYKNKAERFQKAFKQSH